MTEQPKVASYLAEGVPFETRCEIAVHSLRGLKTNISQSVDTDLNYMQEKRNKNEERKSTLSPKAAETLDEWLIEDLDLISRSSQEAVAIVWNAGLEMTRLISGPDAVYFALEILKHERKGN